MILPRPKINSMKSEFTTTCMPSKLADIRRFLYATLSGFQVAEGVKHEIVLAVDEACANAIIHGNNCDVSKVLRLEVRREEKQLTVEISDVGVIDNDELDDAMEKSLDELIHERKAGGLGLKLIYSLMDEVNYFARDNKNICSLRKKL